MRLYFIGDVRLPKTVPPAKERTFTHVNPRLECSPVFKVLVFREPWILSSAWHKLSMVVYSQSTRSGPLNPRGSEIQGQPWLYSEFEGYTSMSCTSSCLKKNLNENQTNSHEIVGTFHSQTVTNPLWG